MSYEEEDSAHGEVSGIPVHRRNELVAKCMR